MCQQYPNIQRLTAAFRFQHQQKIPGLGRATILEISSDSLETEVISFEDPLHFQSYLDGTRDASDNGIQRLCILEDVVSDYVESIGSCLMIDPCFFATHLQLVSLAGSYPGAYPCGPPMPSTCNSNKSFSVVFHELVNHVPGRSHEPCLQFPRPPKDSMATRNVARSYQSWDHRATNLVLVVAGSVR